MEKEKKKRWNLKKNEFIFIWKKLKRTDSLKRKISNKKKW